MMNNRSNDKRAVRTVQGTARGTRQAPSGYASPSVSENRRYAVNTGEYTQRRSTAKPNARAKGMLQGLIRRFDDRDFRYGAIKLALVLLLVIFVFYTFSVNSARNVDISVLTARIEGMIGISELQRKETNGVRKTLGLDVSDYDDWLFYSADSLMDVSELLIVRSANPELRANAQDCVDARLASQKEVFRDYGINQYQLLENAVVITRGDYLFYCVSENADAWSDAFIECVS